MNEYCQILEVSPTATIKEIKDAYRKKAGRIHPDVNPSPTAHEDFITLTEAYESMLRGKTGRVYNETSRNYTRASSAHSEADLREQSRERARRAARMKYQEFINSDYYKSKMSQYQTIEFWGSLLFFIPLFYLQTSWLGRLESSYIFAVVFMSGLTLPLLYNMFLIVKKNKIQNILDDTLNLFMNFIKSDVFLAFGMIAINLFVLYVIGLKTLIHKYIIIGAYVIIPLIIYIFKEFYINILKQQSVSGSTRFVYALGLKLSELKRPNTFIWGVFPSLFSLFLIINTSYYQSERVVHKEFECVARKHEYFLKYEDEAYDNYLGPRYFLDEEQYKYGNIVTLKLKKGLFGIEVLEDYDPNVK
jgi:hypothetical protein